MSVQLLDTVISKVTEHAGSITVQLFVIIGLLWVARRLLSFLRAFYVYFLRPGTNIKKYGSWTIVTGCTDGIGKAIAEEFARKGLNVLLISRTQSKLDEQAKELSSKFKIETKTLAIDYTSEDPSIYDKVANAIKGLDIGILDLVNNVGAAYDHAEYLHLLDKSQIERIIRLNVYSTTYMTYTVLPGMLDRKKGAIINISSVSGYMDEPLYALYSGTKAFVNSFSKALYYEYKDRGIYVQCQLPAFVTTKLSKLRSTSFFICNPRTYAKAMISHIGHDNTIISYWTHALQITQALNLPEWVRGKFLLSRGKDIRRRAYAKKEAQKKQ